MRQCIKCNKEFDEDEDYVYAKNGRLCIDCMEEVRNQFNDMFGVRLENNSKFYFEIEIGDMINFLGIIKKEYTNTRYIINFIDIYNMKQENKDRTM